MAELLSLLMPAIGWSLLHFVWQGLLIGWAATLVLQLLRNARPQARYALACGAMLLCAALPLAGIVWRLLDAASAVPAADPAALLMVGAAAQGAAASGALAMPALMDGDQLISWQYALQRQLPWLVLLWAGGAAFMTLRLSLGLLWVRERTLQAQALANADWQQRLDRLAQRLGLHRPVRLALADQLDSPMTAGCWKPVVLLPASLLTGMPADLLEALLAHELAHIKRHDYLVNLVQSAIEILLFYHPSVWMLSRHIRNEREQIADDLAASTLGEPRRLALALSELDRFQFATPQLALGAQGGNLMSRIKRLLRPDSQPLSWKIAAPLLGLCTACAVLYAHAAPQPPVIDAPAAPAVPAVDAPAAPSVPSALPAVPPVPAAVALSAPHPLRAAPAAPIALAALAADVAPAAPAAKAAPAAPASLAAPAAPAAKAAPAAPASPAAPAAKAAPAAPASPAAPVAAAALAAPPAPPAPPVADEQSGVRRDGRVVRMGFGHLTINNNAKDGYAIKRGNGYTSISSGRSDMAELSRLEGSVQGDFIWYRDGGKAWLIKDPALLAKANAAWAASDALNQQMKAQSKEMEQYSKAMEAMGEKMRALSDQAGREERGAPPSKLEQVAREQAAVALKMEAVARRMERSRESGAEREALQREMQTLKGQMEPFEQQLKTLSAEFEKSHAELAAKRAPMQALSAQMREAGKPMEALGKKMGELGRQQGRLSREADQTVRALIQEAVRNGQAEAIPAPRG